MKRKALVFGVTGQDGSYLAEQLLARDYAVSGLVRRSSNDNLQRIAHLLDQIELIPGDLSDQTSIERALTAVQPQEVYNLAAQSFVGSSYTEPLHTADITGLGALRLFEAVRTCLPKTLGARVYHASSSEMFGNAAPPQSEATPFAPVSPYACAKVFAHYCAQLYRSAYSLHISCGINFNHESERRGEEFVTRKVTKALGRIQAGQQTELRLGNLSARRDWCHASDVMEAAWLMLQQETPDDYVIASGESHSVQEFVELAFNYASLNVQQYLKLDPSLYRPLDVSHLQGCAAKAKAKLGWSPTVSFSELVQRMVEHDRVGDTPSVPRCC